MEEGLSGKELVLFTNPVARTKNSKGSMTLTRIAVLLANPCTHDTRVITTLEAAVNEGFDVHLFSPPGLAVGADSIFAKINHHKINWKPRELLERTWPLRLLKRISKRLEGYALRKLMPYFKYSLFSGVFVPEIAREKPDIVYSNDLICLPAGYRAARLSGAKLVYDAHELEVHRNPPLSTLKKIFVGRVERKFASRADIVVTVGKFVATELGRQLSRSDIQTVYNSPPVGTCSRNIRKDLGIGEESRLLVYVGKVAIGRGIERVLECLPEMPGVFFATVGPCDPKKGASLSELAKSLHVSDRFRMLPALPPGQVVAYLKGTDLGVISVEPITLSYRYCMPNKLFTLAAANIPIIANCLDEIGGFLRDFGNGETFDFRDRANLPKKMLQMINERNKYLMSGEKLQTFRRDYSREAQLAKLSQVFSVLVTKEAQALEKALPEAISEPEEKVIDQKATEPAFDTQRQSPNVCMVCANALLNDSRILKTAESLCNAGYRVTLYGTQPVATGQRFEKIPGFPFGIVRTENPAWKLKKEGKWSANYKDFSAFCRNFAELILEDFVSQDFSLLHTHDMLGIAVGGLIREHSKVTDLPWVHDMHEYVPGLTELDETLREFVVEQERKNIRNVTQLTTVSPVLSKIVRQSYGIGNVSEILNCPKLQDYDPNYLDVYKDCNLPLGGEIKLVSYHGNVKPIRGVHHIIDALFHLPNEYHLGIICNSKGEYVDTLKNLANEKAPGRVHFLPYVPANKTSSYIRSSFATIHPIEEYPNSDLALPNKLFESLHADVPFVCSPLTGMKAFVEEHNNGIVAASNRGEDLANAIRKLDDRVKQSGKICNLLETKKRYSWEYYEQVLVESVYAKIAPL